MQEHDRWLTIAREDLGLAKLGIKGGFLSGTAYHCQQAAEKALKGYLVFRNCEIMKTHDLCKLVDLCKLFDDSFQNVYEAAEALNPFSSKFRYPTEFEIPDIADIKIAIKNAERILKFVNKKLTDPKSKQETFLSPK